MRTRRPSTSRPYRVRVALATGAAHPTRRLVRRGTGERLDLTAAVSLAGRRSAFGCPPSAAASHGGQTKCCSCSASALERPTHSPWHHRSQESHATHAPSKGRLLVGKWRSVPQKQSASAAGSEASLSVPLCSPSASADESERRSSLSSTLHRCSSASSSAFDTSSTALDESSSTTIWSRTALASASVDSIVAWANFRRGSAARSGSEASSCAICCSIPPRLSHSVAAADASTVRPRSASASRTTTACKPVGSCKRALRETAGPHADPPVATCGCGSSSAYTGVGLSSLLLASAAVWLTENLTRHEEHARASTAFCPLQAGHTFAALATQGSLRACCCESLRCRKRGGLAFRIM
mmetsp:Transcript_4965/g.16133  ORF Transcript_4965/g.16133 Transcript_4965/m.16133 type:complete len:354 (-) Transcript_4965:435-1496(-)